MTHYIPCKLDQIRTGVRWDVPAHLAGQMVEVSYANANPRERSAASDGDAYKCVTDRSLRRCDPEHEIYYRREDVPALRWAVLDIREGGNYGKVATVYDARSDADKHCAALQRYALESNPNALAHLMFEVRQVEPTVSSGDRIRRSGLGY